MIFISQNSQQTYDLGKKLASHLRGGDILAISGELGAGKTVLIKGIAAGFGLKQTIRSPSFNLMKIYHIIKPLKHKNIQTTKYPCPPLTKGGIKGGLNNLTIKQLAHLDCYRLKSPREAIEIGLLDYLGQPDTVTAIEWAEKLKNLLKPYRLKQIKLQNLGQERRKITISAK